MVAEGNSGDPDSRPKCDRVVPLFVHGGTRPEIHFEIVTPVIGMRKSEIVMRGMEFDAPLDQTSICRPSEDAACGTWGGCHLRFRAIAAAGISEAIADRVRVET
jgi:7-cyano-7-deazaguanine synthase in queuosine biosynthesis